MFHSRQQSWNIVLKDYYFFCVLMNNLNAVLEVSFVLSYRWCTLFVAAIVVKKFAKCFTMPYLEMCGRYKHHLIIYETHLNRLLL